jgi:hypothetical protein
MNFFVGGRYACGNGNTVRVIEQIHGDDIHWCDDVGPGRCSKERFSRWLGAGGLAPDSPAAPPSGPRRAKRVSGKFWDYLSMEAASIQGLGSLTIESENPDRQDPIGVSLRTIRNCLRQIKNEAETHNCRPLRGLTAIDRNAGSLQKSIAALIDFLRSSETPSGEVSPQVLQALSDGLGSVNRLRAGLAPYLDQ